MNDKKQVANIADVNLNGATILNLDDITSFRIKPQELHIYTDSPEPRIFLLPDEDIITISNYLLQLRPNDILDAEK